MPASKHLPLDHYRAAEVLLDECPDGDESEIPTLLRAIGYALLANVPVDTLEIGS